MQSVSFKKSILALILSAVLGLQGCGNGRESAALGDSEVYLTRELVPADPESGSNLQRNVQVLRRGERKDALILVAPAVLRATLQEAFGKGTLECWAAPVFDIGDGIQMSIYLRRNGVRFLKVARYFDPGRTAADRNWIQVSVPLEVSKGDQLEIDVSAGPQGDLVADWLALSNLRFVGLKR